MAHNKRQEKLRILYIDRASTISGAERSLLCLIEGLNKEAYSPLLMCPGPGPLSEFCATHGINVVHVPLRYIRKFSNPLAFLPYLWDVPRAVYQIVRIGQSKQIHLIHSNSPSIAIYGGLAARFLGIPHIVHIRDIYSGTAAAWLMGMLVQRTADVILAVSEAAKSSYVQANPSLAGRIKVVYNGVIVNRFAQSKKSSVLWEYSIPQTCTLVGWIGQLSAAKGVKVLVEAAQMVIRRFPEVRFLVVGEALESRDRGYKRELLSLVDKLGLANYVIFTGFREDIPEVLATIDILVHTSLFPDPLPRVILEGMAAGKPVVASNVGGVPELVVHGETGLIFDPGNVNGLVSALCFLLSHKTEATRMGEAGRNRVARNFTAEAYAKNIESIYMQILQRTN